MIYGEALVTLALKNQKVNQKKLAERLKVSPPVITQWKNGYPIPFDKEDVLIKMTGIQDLRLKSILLLVELGEKQYENISRFFKYCLRSSVMDNETGYHSRLENFIVDDEIDPDAEVLFSVFFESFYLLAKNVGIDMSAVLPNDISLLIERDIEHKNDDTMEEDWEIIFDHPLTKLTTMALDNFINLEGFETAFFLESFSLVEQDLVVMEFREKLFDLAIATAFAEFVGFSDEYHDYFTIDPMAVREFEINTKREIHVSIQQLKNLMYTQKIPFRNELMKFITSSPEELGGEAEEQSFSQLFAEGTPLHFNNQHPDYYMNEILTSLEVIKHQNALIMEKLGL